MLYARVGVMSSGFVPNWSKLLNPCVRGLDLSFSLRKEISTIESLPAWA